MYAHNSSFRNVDKRTETTLSEHIWGLKDQDLDYILTWKILEKTHAFNPITLQCKLCLSEIYHIIMNPDQASLNRRIEAYNYCRHRKKYLLANARAYEYKAGALILKSVMTRRHGDWVNILAFIFILIPMQIVILVNINSNLQWPRIALAWNCQYHSINFSVFKSSFLMEQGKYSIKSPIVPFSVHDIAC